jgi:hypothetical protein
MRLSKIEFYQSFCVQMDHKNKSTVCGTLTCARLQVPRELSDDQPVSVWATQ